MRHRPSRSEHPSVSTFNEASRGNRHSSSFKSRAAYPLGAEIGGKGGGIEGGLHELESEFGMGRVFPKVLVFVRILAQVEEFAQLLAMIEG